MKTRSCLVLVVGMVLLVVAFAPAQNTVQITKGPFVEHKDANSAVIAWSTNEPSSTVVKYGTDRNNLSQVAQAPWGGLTHRVTVKTLQPGRTYFFQVESGQAPGSHNNAVSGVGTFDTTGGNASANTGRDNGHEIGRDGDHDRDRDGDHSPGRDEHRGADSAARFRITNGPVIEGVRETSATVAWSTNLPSSSIVKYGRDYQHLDQTAEQPWGATTHRVELKNLQPHTRYYLSVHSAQGQNAPGQSADAGPMPFTTSGRGGKNWQEDVPGRRPGNQ